MCSEEYMELFIQVLQYLLPDRLQLDGLVREAFEEGRDGFQNLAKKGTGTALEASVSTSPPPADHSHSAGEIFLFWWQVFMGSLLLLFFLSCISHFAQVRHPTTMADLT